jgi:rRNA maturation protein Nop10
MAIAPIGYMSDTTITLDSEVKQRLSLYRHPRHDSWNDTLESLMMRLPTMEDIDDGCPNCGRHVESDLAPEETHGVSHWFSYPSGDGNRGCHANYCCSPECAGELAEDMQSYVPENPDLVVIGGHEQPRVEFSGANFYLDGETREVGIPLPGAFSGTDSYGEYEYEYVGEPVYIRNDEKWVQSGVVSDIIHQEGYTTLLLGYDCDVVEENRP